MKQKIVITTAELKRRAIAIIEALPLEPVHEVSIRPWEETRRTIQNDKMWAMLTDISSQVDWHGQKLTTEEWKDVFTAALKRQKVVPGIDGGFVVIGMRTSKMKVAEMAELIELMTAFGVQHNVKFKAPSWMDEEV